MKSYSKKYVTTLMGMALFFMICLIGATAQATPQDQESRLNPNIPKRNTTRTRPLRRKQTT